MSKKTYALTIRFTPLEAAVLEALSTRESNSTAALVRRAVLTYGRDALSESQWASAVKQSDAGAAWNDWESPTVRNLKRNVSDTLLLPEGPTAAPSRADLDASALRDEIRAVDRRVDSLAVTLGVKPPASRAQPHDNAAWVGEEEAIDWSALVSELRIDAHTVKRFARPKPKAKRRRETA